MGIRGEALVWLLKKLGISDRTRVFSSKYYPPNQSRATLTKTKPVQAWWLEIPIAKIMKWSGNFYLVCQKPDNLHDFYCLEVGIDFLQKNLKSLFIRTDNDKLSLWLSAEKKTLFIDLRGDKTVNFSAFLRETN
jgi:hypothetical protein